MDLKLIDVHTNVYTHFLIKGCKAYIEGNSDVLLKLK